jgi:hypothetical protein
MWKEATVAYFRYSFGTSMGRPRKTTKTLSRNSLCRGLKSNLVPPEYEGVLISTPTILFVN